MVRRWGAIAVVLALLAGAAAGQEAAPAREWVERAAHLLAQPPDRPRRVMLVFPLVEEGSETGEIGRGRGLIALQAMWLSSFAPDRVLDTWDFHGVPQYYVDQQLIGAGRAVTEKKIKAVCASLDTPNYATGRLEVEGGSYAAALTFHGENGEQQKTHDGPLEELHRLPCLIARDVVDYMGVELTAEQRQAMAASPLGSTELFEEAAERIAAFHYCGGMPGEFWFALPNRHRSAWTDFMRLHAAPMAGLDWVRGDWSAFAPVRRSVAYDFQEAEYAFVMADSGGRGPDWPGRKCTELLDADPYNPLVPRLLSLVLEKMGERELAERVLGRYETVFGESPVGLLHRGRTWHALAWEARGAGFASEVTEEGWRLFHERGQRAHADLEAVRRAVPLCWDANTKLIWVATGEGLGHEYARARLEEALAACPTAARPYSELLWSLTPRWGGSRAALLALGRECAATERYDTRIPEVLILAHEYVAANMILVADAEGEEADSIRDDYMSRPEVWQDIRPVLVRMYEAAEGDHYALCHVASYLDLMRLNGERELARRVFEPLADWQRRTGEETIGSPERERTAAWLSGEEEQDEPVAGPLPAEEGEPADWVARVRRLIESPPDRQRRAMVVFPLADADSPDGRIGWGRGLIALHAMWLTSFAPDRLLDTWDFHGVPWFLVHQHLVGRNGRLTDEKVRAVLACLGTQNAVTGTLQLTDDSYVARVRLEGENGARERTHQGARDELHRLPCLIAQDVLDYLGVDLSEEQSRAVAKPPLSAVELFDEVADHVSAFYHGDNEYVPYWRDLAQRCSTPWTEFMFVGSSGRRNVGWTLDRWAEHLSHSGHAGLVHCKGQVAFWAARWGQRPPEVAGEALVELVRDDPLNPDAVQYLARLLARQGDWELALEVIQRLIPVYGLGPVARYHYGRFLSESAWDMRSFGSRVDVEDAPPEFRERLLRAAKVLRRVVEEEPRFWRATAELIRIGKGLDAPESVVRKWFDDAVAVCPTVFKAYEHMHDYLRPDWRGSVEQTLAFGREAAATELYETRIPALLLEAHRRVVQGRFGSGDVPASFFAAGMADYFRRPDVWQEVEPVLRKLTDVNPYGYRDLTRFLQIAYWRRDRDLVAGLIERMEHRTGDRVMQCRNVHIVNDKAFGEITAWLAEGTSPLLAAVREGDAGAVRRLLDEGADVNQRGDDGSTALMAAVRARQNPVVGLLLESGADPNLTDESGRAALHVAAEINAAGLAAHLIEQGVQPDAPDANGDTPLTIAAKAGHVEVARVLLEHGADIAARGQYGATPLHRAAGRGKTAVVRLLLEEGADPDAEAPDGRTPLSWAARWGHTDAMEALLRAGAEPERTDEIGLTPLHRAALNGRGKAVEILLAREPFLDDNFNDWAASPLSCAARSGHLEVVEMLLRAGADTEVQDGEGRTVLMVAACEGHGPVVEALIAAGADLEMIDDEGRTALHRAAEEGHAEVVEVLLRLGADARAADAHGRAPLRTARTRGHEDVVRLLQKHAGE
jgi:cytohesin